MWYNNKDNRINGSRTDQKQRCPKDSQIKLDEMLDKM